MDLEIEDLMVALGALEERVEQAEAAAIAAQLVGNMLASLLLQSGMVGEDDLAEKIESVLRVTQQKKPLSAGYVEVCFKKLLDRHRAAAMTPGSAGP